MIADEGKKGSSVFSYRGKVAEEVATGRIIPSGRF